MNPNEVLLAILFLLLSFYCIGVFLCYLINTILKKDYKSLFKIRHIFIILMVILLTIGINNEKVSLAVALIIILLIVFKIIGKGLEYTPDKKTLEADANTSDTSAFSPNNTLLPLNKNRFAIHPDLFGLIWIADGKYKNYTPQEKNYKSFTVDGVTLKIELAFPSEEPSLIYTNLPIATYHKNTNRPPYFPRYVELSPDQRYEYLQLLKNPYDSNIDIGYVFVLYYGLERHLLLGNFDRAFDTIIKLRNVHKNNSFQSYSGNALILSAIFHKRGEKILDLLSSVDRDQSYNLSDNLFLLSCYSFGIPLQARDIVRLAKTFEFSNTNYIKKYPDIFNEVLSELLLKKYGETSVLLNRIIKQSDINKIKRQEVRMFANMSIVDKDIQVPMICDNFKLKKEMNALLEEAHDMTKKKIAAVRKKPADVKKIIIKKDITI